MPFPDLPPERIPGSPGHLNDHQLIDQALDYIQQSGYRDDPNFPPLPDVPVLGQSGHVTAHDRILAILEYVKANPPGAFVWATVSNTPTGTYKGDDGHTYAYYEFTTDGTLTVTTAGLLEVFMISAGSGSSNSWQYSQGGGGRTVRGFHPFDAGSRSVAVAPAVAPSQTGGPSSIGNLTTYEGTGVSAKGAGATSSEPNAGIVTTITGSPLDFGRAAQSSPRPNRGDGGGPRGTNNGGSSGIVIVKTRLN